MKSKLLTFVVLCSFSLANSQAQYLNYDLSKYKLPDIKKNMLDFNLNASHSKNNNSTQFSGYSDNDQKTNSYNGLIDINYYNFRNSLKYQGTQQINLNLQPNIFASTTNIDTSKSKQLSGYISLTSNNRFYNQSLVFFEVDPYLYYNANYRKSGTEEIKGDATESYNHFSISAPVSVGYGRIEPVEDARLAIYIIEDLSKKGKIVNPPSESTITELAREISKIKRKRFFDSRIRKIEELQVIDSFLLVNNIVSSNDIKYFTSLGDQWDYAAGPSRNSGFSINAGFDNDINIYKNKQSDPMYDPITNTYNYNTITNTTNIFKAGVFLRIDYSKPLNLYWQSDLYTVTSYNLEFTKDPSDKEDVIKNFNTNILYTSLNYTIRYLPDSRTSIGLTVGSYYNNSNGDRYLIDTSGPIEGHLKHNEFSLSAGIDMYYYFSPQLRIILDWSLNSSVNKSTTKYASIFNDQTTKINYFRNYFSLGLVYSFF